MDLMVFVARVVLAIVFAVAGFAKLADRKGTRALAVDFGVPASFAGVFEWLLPIAELICAGALLPAASATLGAMATFGMLVIFIVAIGVSLARGRRPECHCFGQIHSAPVGWTTIARNVVLSGLAVFVIVEGQANGQPGIADAFRALGGVPWVWAAALGVVGLTAVAVIGMTYQLLRQNGRLALRIEALEARLGPPPVQEKGLAPETVAPGFTLSSLDGGRVSLDDLTRAHTELLLLFTEPGCGACEAMLPEVAGWQRKHEGRLRIVPISHGDVESNRQKMTASGIAGVLLQEDREVAQAYQVDAVPSAVLLTAGKIASFIAAGDEAIRSLVADATRPKPYAQGDQVSSLQLPDLDGRSVDLAQLGGRKTVLLFWNPTCGFCIDALDDVKWWESHRDPQLGDLLVISAGDTDANRAQGFRSRVVLDQDFSAGNRFGAGGTPSAVIIDERGRMGSAVAVGAPEVLALAGSAAPAR